MYLDSEGRTIFTGTKPEDFGPFVIMTVRDALNFTVDPVEEIGALLEDCRIVGKTLMYSVSTGHYRGTPVSIISTGTGGPSRELAMADLINNETQAHTVIDIGSCGTYQDFQDWGDANIDLLMRVPHHPDLDPSGDRGSGVRGNEYRLGQGAWRPMWLRSWPNWATASVLSAWSAMTTWAGPCART